MKMKTMHVALLIDRKQQPAKHTTHDNETTMLPFGLHLSTTMVTMMRDLQQQATMVSTTIELEECLDGAVLCTLSLHNRQQQRQQQAMRWQQQQQQQARNTRSNHF
jgi:hypothetical protein